MFFGFWGKLTLHILTQNPIGEATGEFSVEILNKAATISGWFAFIFLVFQVILKHRKLKIASLWKNVQSYSYPKYFNLIFLIIIFIISILNHKLGIFQTGVKSSYSLFLPISILFYWFLGPGSSFLLFSLTSSNKYNYLDTFTIALTMTAISVTTISRNALLYFSYPILVKFIYEIKQLKMASIHTFIIFIFFVFSLFAVTQARRIFYYPEDTAHISKTGPEKYPQQIRWSYVNESIAQVFLNRWIGLEGVIVGKMHQSDENFKTLINESAKVNSTSLYRELSGSNYPTSGNYLFYTMPGPLGLLSFIESNSLKIISWIVYLSILGFTYLIIELFLAGMPKSVISWWAASNMTQISLFPIYNIKIYAVYFVIIILTTMVVKKISDNYFRVIL
jgi:hypothetical protein